MGNVSQETGAQQVAVTLTQRDAHGHAVVGAPELGKVQPAAIGLVLGLLIGHLLGAHRTSRVYREALKLATELRKQGP